MDLATICGIVTAFASFGSLLFVIFQIRGFKNQIKELKPVALSIASLLRYEEDKDGNPLMDARLGKMIDAFSSGIAKSLKMSLLGSLSGPARLEKGLKGAIAKDVVEKKAPIINLVGDFLGFNTQKYISKHPDAMLQLAQRFAPQLQGLLNPQGQTQGSRLKNSFGNG